MREDTSNPQVNISKIPGGGGVAGALFAVLSMLILLIGIPRLRIFFVGALVLGLGIALVLHFVRRETPGKPWILSNAQQPDQPPSLPRTEADRPEHRRQVQAILPA